MSGLARITCNACDRENWLHAREFHLTAIGDTEPFLTFVCDLCGDVQARKGLSVFQIGALMNAGVPLVDLEQVVASTAPHPAGRNPKGRPTP